MRVHFSSAISDRSKRKSQQLIGVDLVERPDARKRHISVNSFASNYLRALPLQRQRWRPNK